MKKVFIGLLILAAGTAIFFLVRKINRPLKSTADIDKESIIGEWKLDSIQLPKDADRLSTINIFLLLDSNLTRYRYMFTKDSALTLHPTDSVIIERSKYELNVQSLVFRYDSINADSFKISMPARDSLVLRDDDSVTMFFIRAGK